MKKIAIAILLILFVGFAGAVTIPEPTYNFGPSAGFKNAATIQASDMYAEDDFKVGDDAQIVGDLAITGASSFASLYLSSGLNVAGTSALNVTTATSVTATGTIRGEQLTSTDDALVYGTLTANDVVSNTTVAAADITASDDAIITDDLTVDGGARIDETLTVNAVSCNGTVASADLTASDDAIITDDLVVDGAARIDEALTVASVASNGTVTGTSITGSATIQGEQITSTDDMQAYGDLLVNTATVNGTVDVNGALTTRDITLDANKNITLSGTGTISGASSISGTDITGSGTVQGEQITSTDDLTVYGTATVNQLWVNETSDFLKEVELSVALDRTSYEIDTDTAISDTNIPGLYFVGNASADQTITLPAASYGDGCSLTFVVTVDVGAYNVVIEGDESETINGAANKTNSDQYSVIEVTSDGTAWYITDSIGTWS